MIAMSYNSLRMALLLSAFSVCAYADIDSIQVEKTLEKHQCRACHGDTGISVNNAWPNLAGQKPAFLLEELKKFRDNKRTDNLMSPIAKALSDTEMQILAGYFSSQLPASGQSQKASSNQHAAFIAGSLCVVCHGVNGISVRNNWPNIAGQKSEYIYNQIVNYNNRTRESALMNAVTHLLEDDEIRPLADFYSDMGRCGSVSGEIPCNLKSPGTGDKITEIAEGVYTYSFSIWSPVFVVTPKGIVLIDPTSVESSLDLKEKLRRFNVPVRYVVLTHAHPDHSTGASVFADEAIIISHEKAKGELERRQQLEVAAAKMAKRDARLDPLPDVTFSDQLTLSLGGKTIKLESLKPYSHSVGDVVLITIVESELLIAVDSVVPNGFAFMDFRATPILQLLDDTRKLEERNFKFFSNGHSLPMPKAMLIGFREYVEFIVNKVSDAITAGKSIEETKASLQLPDHLKSSFGKMLPPGSPETLVNSFIASRLRFNVEGAYKQLQAYMKGQDVIDIHNINGDKDH